MKISPAGENLLSAPYGGEYQGQQVQAKGYGLLSPPTWWVRGSRRARSFRAMKISLCPRQKSRNRPETKTRGGSAPASRSRSRITFSFPEIIPADAR